MVHGYVRIDRHVNEIAQEIFKSTLYVELNIF